MKIKKENPFGEGYVDEETGALRFDIAYSPDGRMVAYPFDKLLVKTITGRTFHVLKIYLDKETEERIKNTSENVKMMCDMMKEKAAEKKIDMGGLLWGLTEKELEHAHIVIVSEKEYYRLLQEMRKARDEKGLDWKMD